MSKIDSPNYTQVPNSILGDILPGNVASPGLMAELEGAELKVLLVVCRLTFGYHKKQRRASVGMIAQMTGLSRQGVYNAAEKLEKLGLIERTMDGGITLWQVTVNSVDNDLPELLERDVNSVDIDCQLIRHPSRKERKKKLNNNNDKEKNNNDIEVKPAEQQSVKSASQAMFSALADLCEYDLGLMTNETRGALNQAEKKMRENKYTPEDVTAFGEWWYLYDWRGKEKQPPTLAQIRETWGRFRAWQKEKIEQQAPVPAPADQVPLAPVPVYVTTWANAQTLMKGQMTKATFDAWVRDCEAQPNTNGTFVLRAKSPEAKDWIDNRLSKIFLNALKSVKPDISKLEVIVI